jgi:hypothetical protein
MKPMTRLSLSLAGALLLSAPALAQTKWNLPAAYPADNFHSENLNAFSKEVSDATGGKLQITVHANASLFKAPEIKRAVQTGQAQAGEVLMSLHENEDPVYGLDVVPVPRRPPSRAGQGSSEVQKPGGGEVAWRRQGLIAALTRSTGRRRASTPRWT